MVKPEDETPHDKTDSKTNDNGGNAKLDEVLEKVGLMMRQVINIETLIKNPLSSKSFLSTTLNNFCSKESSIKTIHIIRIYLLSKTLYLYM
jgi:hypothetical protein